MAPDYCQESELASVLLVVKMLTLLCWSREAVLLGSGLTLSWLLWHLCDRGFLGNVVLYWLLHSGL